jgi:hypothetical protein
MAPLTATLFCLSCDAQRVDHLFAFGSEFASLAGSGANLDEIDKEGGRNE